MKLRCGVIGVGHLGQHHASKYAQLDTATLVGVADTNAERARDVAQRHATRSFTDVGQLLDICDAISIAADTRHHHYLVKEALQCGVHVLVEKPITQTIDQAQELIELAAARQLVLQVGHLERFNPAILTLVPMLRNPLFINCQRVSTFVQRGGLKDTDVIIDLMIHDIDLICYLMKDDAPVSIDAIGGQLFTSEVDICDARLGFSKRRTATLTTSRIGRRVNRMIKVFEPGVCFIADLQNKTLQHIERDEAAGEAYRLKTTEVFCDNSKDALFLEIASFVDSVLHGTPPLVGGAEGRNAIKLATRIRESVQTAGQALHILSRKD